MTKKPAPIRDPFDPTWKVNPDTRTIAKLRDDDWPIRDIVEQRIPGTFIRRDFFNAADIVAARPGCILAIQATSDTTGGNSSRRLSKCGEEPRMRTWLEAGGQFQVWAWSIRKARGEKSRVTLRRWMPLFGPVGVEWTEMPEETR